MPPRRYIRQPATNPSRFDQVPTWIQGKLKTTVIELNKLENKVFNLEIALNALREHAAEGTVPRSLNVSMSVMVNNRQQAAMDKVVEEATFAFQKTLLNGIITARTQELHEQVAEITRLKNSFLSMMDDTLDQMIQNDIVKADQMERTSITNTIQNVFEMITEQDRQEIRTREFLKFQSKKDAEQKRNIERQERRVNETLEDDTTKRLKSRLEKVEKEIKSLTKPTRKPAQTGTPSQTKPFPGSKIKENSTKLKEKFPKRSRRVKETQTSGPTRIQTKNIQKNSSSHPKGIGRGSGRENRPRRASFTRSIAPSASPNRSFRPRRS